MNRFIKIGGAVTGLVLAYASYADTYRVTLMGDVPGFCTITQTAADFDTGSAAVTGSSSHRTVTFDSSFADSDGHGLPVSGHATTKVHTNTVCKFALNSTNGTLWNSTASPAGAARPYRVNFYNATGSQGSWSLSIAMHREHLLERSICPLRPQLELTPGGVRLRCAWHGSDQLAAGTYTDTLVLSVTTN